MKTLPTGIYRVTQASETLFISLEEWSAADFDDHNGRDHSLPLEIAEETLEIPVVESEIHFWDGGDRLYPHLHYTCPRCQQAHNVDLYDDDPNPRFGTCDSCGWKSMVWIEWDEAGRAAMDTDKERYLEREIAAMRREPPTESQIYWLMYSLEGFAPSDPDATCCLMIELWPIAADAFMHVVCDAIDLWIADHRSPAVMAKLTQCAASGSDLQLRDHCSRLLEILRE